MQRIATLALMVLLTNAFLTSPANALVLILSRTINSIELTVFDADVIVRGQRIGPMKPFDAKPQPRSNPILRTTQPSFHKIFIGTLKVSEVIKGSKELADSKILIFASESNDVETEDSIFFLVSVAHFYNSKVASAQQLESFDGQNWVLDAEPRFRTYNGTRTPRISLDPDDEAHVFDSGGHVVKGKEAILDAVRREVRNSPVEEFGRLSLSIPNKSESSDDQHAIDTFLNILVDRRAEARAVQWIKSNSPTDRLNGARVLSFCRSPQNIARLESLLDDSSVEPIGRFRFDSTALGKWKSRSFPIREAAWQALNGWGLSPKLIPLGTAKYPTIYVRPWVIGTLGIGMIVVLLSFLVIRWVRTRRFSAGAIALNYYLLVICTSMWILSQWRIVDVIFDSLPEADRHELGLIDGKVRWLKIENWPDPTPASITFVPRASETLEDWQPQSLNVPMFPSEYIGRLGFSFARDRIGIRGLGDRVYRAYTAPLWAIVIVLCILPAARIVRLLRGRRRVAQNRCIDCGYDLRASVGRCPECGREC